MDRSGFGSESHVAQRSRRNKLRVHQTSSTSSKHLPIFPTSSFLHNHPSLLPSELVNFSTDDLMARQELGTATYQSGTRPIVGSNFEDASSFISRPLSSPHFNSLPKVPQHYDQRQNDSNWKSFHSHQSCDNSMVTSGSDQMNPNRMFVNHSPQNFGDTHFSITPSYRNINDFSVSMETEGLDQMVPLVHHNIGEIRDHDQGDCDADDQWDANGNELALLPAFSNQSNVLRNFDNTGSNWMDHRSIESGGDHLGYWSRKNDEELRTLFTDSNPQGLSLSLSSNPHSKFPIAHFEDQGCGPEDEYQRSGFCRNVRQESHPIKSGYSNICPIPKPSIISKSSGRSLQDIVGISTNGAYRNMGPLGPFTGYAAILKSSKFLKLAQQLLDELCNLTSYKFGEASSLSERISSGEFNSSSLADHDHMHAANANIQNEVNATKGNNNSSSALSLTFHSLNETCCDGGGTRSSVSLEAFRPEFQQKKAKLLHMQEEICRRYKQYQQQMQMVVSSFESVSGLSSVTPYISLALGTISKHFWCLRNAILEQQRHDKKASGEDHVIISSPTAKTSGSNLGDTNPARLKYIDQSHVITKHNKSSGVNNIGYLETQAVRRPQRGLPERSVAILRAWLFEHFLHPYPTDTDKHMLATQTGLTRNQVSNWFVNARVRVWKTMVEEIHALETKGGLAEPNQDHSRKNEIGSGVEGTTRWRIHGDSRESKNRSVNFLRGQYPRETISEHREKRLRLDGHGDHLNMMDGALTSFMPCQQTGIDLGGLGAVSLTLGLRHRVEGASPHQQFQQEDCHILRQYGSSQMIHDYAG